MEQLGKNEYTKIAKVSQPIIVIFQVALILAAFILIKLAIGFVFSANADQHTIPLFNNSGEFHVHIHMPSFWSISSFSSNPLSIRDKIIIFTLTSAILGSIAWLCHKVITLFKLFKAEQVFCQQAVRLAKQIAIFNTLLISALFVAKFGQPFVEFLANLFHGKTIKFSSSTFSFLGLLISIAIFWLFVWLLEIGTALYDDNKLTV